MKAQKRKKLELRDRKNILVYLFWSLVNKICIALRFRDFQVIGRQHLPKSGPFLLVSNHITRWDGLIVYELIGRPANFMVSPNELKGSQGVVLASMGSFPADPRVDFIKYSLDMFKNGQGMVVFPEGNIFRDGTTHPFKLGAARIALAAAQEGIDLPIIPAAIHYAENGKVAQMVLGKPVRTSEYFNQEENSGNNEARALSDKLHGDVVKMRSSLGQMGDKLASFIDTLRDRWPSLLQIEENEVVIAEGETKSNQSVVLKLSARLPELKVS